MDSTQAPVFRFGGFVLDVAERQLLARGEPVPLTPKVFETLVLLVGRAGHVVAKDELMTALWPRGFVDESNLTKHIWTIRKALADHGPGDGRIETVPKYGYRFVATMVEDACAPDDNAARVDPAEPTPDPTLPAAVAGGGRILPGAIALPVPEPALTAAQAVVGFGDAASTAPVATRSSRRRPGWAAALALLAIFAMAGRYWMRHPSIEPAGSATAAGRSLAIVQFNNLSQNPRDAWLGPALAEMLSTEVALDGDLHTIPGEMVRGTETELPVVVAGGYAPQSLGVLRRRLAADFVLSGSYLVSGSGDDAHLRVDLALQDARSGTTVALLSRSASIEDLTKLVTAAGSALRERLGARAPSATALAAAADAQPPTPDVARRMGFALDALHRFDPAHARDELLEVIAEAPTYAPAYSHLAQAWSMLGYKTKALVAARQAATHSVGLPQRQRLEIDVQVHRAEYDWPATVAALRQLVDSAPANPEYRLQLVDALLAAARIDEASTALSALGGVAARDDPRVELAGAAIASARSDPQAAVGHAARAMQMAAARGDPGLVADAEVAQAREEESTDHKDSEQLLRRAMADYQRIGNPHGEAYARQNLANMLWDDGEAKSARDEYENAMAIYQRIGDRNGIAAIYSNLARMDWSSGDRDAAITAAQHALSLRRETGDITGQAWNLAALGTMESDESASAEVVDLFRQSIALDEQAGETGHRIFALTSLADVLRMRGELPEAERVCAQAKTLAATLVDPAANVPVVVTCSQVALARGDVDAAAQILRRFIKDSRISTEVGTIPNLQLILASIEAGNGDWAQARDLLLVSIDGWKKADLATGEAVAESQLALCEDALGDSAARDRARDRAKTMRKSIDERGEMFALDVALARLDGTAGEPVLRELAADSSRRDWIENSLEAKLALRDVQRTHGANADANATGEQIRAVAKAHGFGWILMRLDRASAATGRVEAGVRRQASTGS